MNEYVELREQHSRRLGCGFVASVVVLSPIVIVLGLLVTGGILLLVPTGLLGYLLILDEFVPGAVERAVRAAADLPVAVVVSAAVVGALALISRAGDRLTVAALRSQRAGRGDAAVEDLLESAATLGLAAGVDPIVQMIDDRRWVDVALLGWSGGRPVIVTTTAAADLDRRDREVLIALGLAGALAGSGAGRVRRAVRLGWAVTHLVARAWPLLLAIWLAQYPLVWLVFRNEGLDVIRVDGEPVTLAEAIGLLMAIPFAVAVMAALLLAVPATILSMIVGRGLAESTITIDLGALSLLRDPHHWWASMERLLEVRGRRPRRIGRLADWALPSGPQALRARRRQIEDGLPAVGRSLRGTGAPTIEGDQAMVMAEWLSERYRGTPLGPFVGLQPPRASRPAPDRRR